MSSLPKTNLPVDILQQAFTCANCGELSRFRPNNPHPCGCGGTRWILGSDTKLFDWKANLATVRRGDRPQIAGVIRKLSATLAVESDDPIVAALVEVERGGFEAAQQPQECGHPLAAVDSGGCASCRRERALRDQVAEEKERADAVSAEIGTWMKKVAAAEASAASMSATVVKTCEELVAARESIAEMEPAEAERQRLAEQGERDSSKITMLESECESLRREVEGMDAASARAKRAEESLEGIESLLAEALADAERLRAEKAAAERRVNELGERVERHAQEIKAVVERADAMQAHVIEMKQTHETLIEATAARRAELEDENKAMTAEVARLNRDNAALNKELNEGWLRRGRVVELEGEVDRLVRELTVARDDVAAKSKDAAPEVTEDAAAIASANETLTRELQAAKNEAAALRKQLDESWLGKDRIVALEAANRRVGLELEAARAELPALREKADEADALKAKLLETEAANERLAGELDAETKAAASLRKEIDESWLRKDRVVELEAGNERLDHDLIVARDDVATLTRGLAVAQEDVAALRKQVADDEVREGKMREMEASNERLRKQVAEGDLQAEKMRELEAANERMVRELEAANGKLAAIRASV